jgi:hypothetical protein
VKLQRPRQRDDPVVAALARRLSTLLE